MSLASRSCNRLLLLKLVSRCPSVSPSADDRLRGLVTVYSPYIVLCSWFINFRTDFVPCKNPSRDACFSVHQIRRFSWATSNPDPAKKKTNEFPAQLQYVHTSRRWYKTKRYLQVSFYRVRLASNNSEIILTRWRDITYMHLVCTEKFQ